MSTDGWRNFGTYGAGRDPGNIHGRAALGRALEDVLERMIIDGGIKSPATTRRGLKARMKYLTTTQGGAQAMADAGITASRATLRAWTTGRQRPRPGNIEAIDTAYWNLRATNVLANPGGLKQHLNRGGQGTRVEIHPINQDVVDEHARRRNLRVRRIQVRYVWDAAVDALIAGDTDELEQIWDDIIADLDSDWGAYTYVSHIGLGA
ncbi:hypothetical protein SAMN05216223_1238 [Actinacidiphila yanglinensis]|uniref:Transcriptional regulator n=1 Tax=Actinacidiphila yanglinensis TaxID=310779 RepID=A0A1H6DJ25_9ACTN|nr:hypothetical protein [Actinacidiphila yanglinensis]SEG85212.1 hypothetical protein SAMN05216223_1168 [Actinacidiphila yanglinensis]SEG91016.1 hypothetical protein SAMN05216223_1238 [Actinacidiphila yanglinensis]